MVERTHLHVVGPARLLCTLCPALVEDDVAGELCHRCEIFARLDVATTDWPRGERTGLANVIARVLMTVPPEDVGDFFALVAEVATARH